MPSINAYAYTRLSDSQQAKEGRSGSERQKLSIKKYLSEQDCKGTKIDLIEMQDVGRSAFHGNHRHEDAEFGMFLKQVEAGYIAKGSWLLIEDIDRLTREHFLSAVETTFNPILDAGIEIHVLLTRQVFKGRLNLGEMVDLLVKVESANVYTERLSERVKGYWNKQFRDISQGKKVNLQSRPLWLSWDKDRTNYRLNIKSGCIKTIFEMYLAGFGYRGIADHLNKQGIASLKGKKWQVAPIKRILKDPSVYGRLEYLKRGLTQDGFFPAVVSKETYDRVQILMQKKGSSKVRTSLYEKDNTLQGLMYCECGSPMYHKINSRKKRPDGSYYNQTITSFRLCCTGKNNGNGCNNRDLYYPIIKEMLIKSSDTFNTNHVSQSVVIDHSAEIEGLEQQNLNIMDMTLKMNKPELIERYIQMQEVNLDLIQQLRKEETKPVTGNLLRDVTLNDLSVAEISNYLRMLIKRVDVYSEGAGVNKFLLDDSETKPFFIVEYYNGHKQAMLMHDMRTPLATTAYSSDSQGNMLL
ncbi:recombinase family protein [Vibrio sp. 1CM23M]|uniref:recombinase family protein n=1 Tax=Vibrio sp. 1CM23M TaxID=2929164 RepID=UPI0020C0AC19|nr:recombinase family protein [Vibrio sp. 1CM23M]MCK8073979.1 recombinase family protein [Vibrio sp. 1CM23M]